MNRLLPTGVKLLNSVRDQHIPLEAGAITDTGLNGDFGDLLEIKKKILDKKKNDLLEMKSRTLSHGPSSIMPEFGIPSLIKGDYLNQEGLIAKMQMVQDFFLSALIEQTGLSENSVKLFLDIVSPHVMAAPVRNLLSPAVREATNQISAIELFANLDDKSALSFRNSLSEVRNLVNNTDTFMGRDGPGNIFDSVRLDLLNNKLTTSPLGNLRDVARAYFAGLFPFVEDISVVDYVLADVGNQLGGILSTGSLAVKVVARIIQYKIWLLADVTDMMEGVVISVVDLGIDVVKIGRDVVNDVTELAVAVPQLSVDLLFEMIMIVTDVGEGLIDLPIAVLDLALRLPVELIDVILSLPAGILNGVSIGSIELVTSLWMQLRETLQLYDGYSTIFGISRDNYSLEDFVSNIRNIKSMPESLEGQWNVYGGYYGYGYGGYYGRYYY